MRSDHRVLYDRLLLFCVIGCTVLCDRLGVIYALTSERRFRSLTLVDVFTKECPAIEVDLSINGERVTRVLDRVAQTCGYPKTITVDNGPEFISTALDRWAFEHGVELHFIRPGKPVENAYTESFNGRFRDQCLNQCHFATLMRARVEIELWRLDYNNVRPHSAIGYLAPSIFATTFLGALVGNDSTERDLMFKKDERL